MTEYTKISNGNIIITLINASQESILRIQNMVESNIPKVQIIQELRQMFCYFEWKITEV